MMVKFLLVVVFLGALIAGFWGGQMLGDSQMEPLKTITSTNVDVLKQEVVIPKTENKKPDKGVVVSTKSQTPIETTDKKAEEKPETLIIKTTITDNIDRSGTPVKSPLTHVAFKLPNEPGTINARRAAEILNEKHLVLYPGDVFSYNKIIGRRTEEKGFIYGTLPARDKNGNKIIIKSIGSGVCRLVVALATAASRTELKQIEKKSHDFTPSYFALNRDQKLTDATVYWGNGPQPLTDYKFQNSKNYDITIESSVSDKNIITVDFYKVDYVK